MINNELKLIHKLDASQVLVLSPHLDDDVLGCGGTLAKHTSHGGQVTCVYMTDGAKGDPSGLLTREKLVQVRRNEAQHACNSIGISDLIFLNHPDGNLQATESAIKELKEIIFRTDPQIIFLPFLLDGYYHHDHLETNRIFVEAITHLKTNFNCWAYEIYSPLIPNRLVDITAEIKLKKTAIQMYKSQLRVRNYLEAVMALNCYRGYTLGGPSTQYMEAFLETTPNNYLKLFKYIFFNK